MSIGVVTTCVCCSPPHWLPAIHTHLISVSGLMWIFLIRVFPRETQKVSPYLKGVKVAQLCLTLCDPFDYTVHEILQVRILEWVPISFSKGSFCKGSSQPRDQTQVSRTAGKFFTNWTKIQVHEELCQLPIRFDYVCLDLSTYKLKDKLFVLSPNTGNTQWRRRSKPGGNNKNDSFYCWHSGKVRKDIGQANCKCPPYRIPHCKYNMVSMVLKQASKIKKYIEKE